jgi:RNA polymerase sigma-70 factor (ECF subfamily)
MSQKSGRLHLVGVASIDPLECDSKKMSPYGDDRRLFALNKDMGDEKTENPGELARLLQRATAGDQAAMSFLFSAYRDRLKRMVHLRLSRRLQGRVDDSDVLQEACLEAANRLQEYARDPILPFFLWLRHLTGLKLAEVHRRHLGTQLRDADREVTLHRGGLPLADSASLAAHLLGTLTSPSQAVVKAETRLIVQEALNAMDPVDREILALKHFEQLSTSEIAQILGLSKAGAGSRYLRAIKRLREVLSRVPGFEAF